MLIGLEMVTSAIIPALGFENFKPSFNVLIVLYLAFKIESPLIPFFILLFQYIHSAFSVEGWAAGTIAGVLVSLSVRYIKDMLNFTSVVGTIIVIQIFQLLWFTLTSMLYCMKIGDFSSLFRNIWSHFPESIFISLTAHFIFKVLDKIWSSERNQLGAVS